MNSQLNDDNAEISGDIALKVLEQIPTPVMAVDRDLKLIFLNDAGQRLLGKKWADIKGRLCYDLFNSQHCQTPECRMKGVMEGAETCTVRNEVEIDGRTIPIEYTAAALKDENGNIIGGLEYIIDITERVRQEQKLKEQSRTIMEISTPAIKLWDRVVVLPVVGVIDSLRAQQMMNTMLKKITETLSKVIILDIEGVAAVTSSTTGTRTAIPQKLSGCRFVLFFFETI
ncbi:PAS domain-containing protein [Thermodesulfobacteriota bacterium]